MGQDIGRTSRQQRDQAKSASDQAAKMALEVQRSDLQFLLGRPEFVRYMRRVLANGGLMRSVMTGNSQTFYNSGRQDFTREIWTGLAEVNGVVAMEILKPEEQEKNDG